MPAPRLGAGTSCRKRRSPSKLRPAHPFPEMVATVAVKSMVTTSFAKSSGCCGGATTKTILAPHFNYAAFCTRPTVKAPKLSQIHTLVCRLPGADVL